MTDTAEQPGAEQAVVMLQVRDETGVRARAPLAGERFIIGRDETCHVSLRGGGVSRKHAELFRDKNGNWWVRDLGSSNGTAVNGQRVDERMLDLVADRVHIGKYRLKLIDLAEASTKSKQAAAAAQKPEKRKKRKKLKPPPPIEVSEAEQTKPDLSGPDPDTKPDFGDPAQVEAQIDAEAETLASVGEDSAGAGEQDWNADDITIASEPSLSQPGSGEMSGTGQHPSNEFAAPAPLEDDDDGEPAVPRKLGNYEVQRELGRGGMGAVYLARQLSLNRPVALKVMNKQWAADAEFLAGFMREAYAAAALVHHNITQIYDIGADQGLNFFSMEFIDGQTLGELSRSAGGLDPAEAAGYLMQAARGLGFGHDHGMIHRDVKPDNLMINEHGVVKVNDLGLVKTPESAMATANDDEDDEASELTEINVRRAMGTPAYMSPEQARNAAKADERSDVYSLGCTLYRVITARPLFPGDSPLDVMTKHVKEPVERQRLLDDGVPEWMGDVLMKMIAKDPDQRQQSMNEVVEELRQALSAGGAQPAENIENDIKPMTLAKPASTPAPPNKEHSLPELVEQSAPAHQSPPAADKAPQEKPPAPPTTQEDADPVDLVAGEDDGDDDLESLFGEGEMIGNASEPVERAPAETGLSPRVIVTIIGLGITLVVIWTVAWIVLSGDK